jgi:hypothetical protein
LDCDVKVFDVSKHIMILIVATWYCVFIYHWLYLNSWWYSRGIVQLLRCFFFYLVTSSFELCCCWFVGAFMSMCVWVFLLVIIFEYEKKLGRGQTLILSLIFFVLFRHVGSVFNVMNFIVIVGTWWWVCSHKLQSRSIRF